MVRTSESVGRPFCAGWPDWRPDASWAVPQLPDNWFDVDRGEAVHGTNTGKPQGVATCDRRDGPGPVERGPVGRGTS